MYKRQIIEINSHTITYWLGLPGEEVVSQTHAYTPDTTVTISNFAAAGADNEDFVLPAGKGLSTWALAEERDGVWTYVNEQGAAVTDPEQAAHYAPGAVIPQSRQNYHLVAVFVDAPHKITIQYDCQWNQDFRDAYRTLNGASNSGLPDLSLIHI